MVEGASVRGRRSWLPWAIGLLALLTIGYAFILTSFVRTGGTHRTSFAPAGGSPADLRVEATMLSVDPVLNTYKMRLKYDPQGAYRGGQQTLTRPLDVTVDDVGGEHTRNLAVGRPLPVVDLTLDALGDTSTYPLDSHTFTLELDVRDEHGTPVPTQLDFVSAIDDWTLTPRLASSATAGEVVMDVGAERSPSVLIMSFGLMTVLVLLVVVNVAMVIRAVRLHRVEFTTLASLGATLFAIPGIRNGMPNTPPVGTLSDFLVFFWALMIVGLCLVAAAMSWLHTASAELKGASRAS